MNKNAKPVDYIKYGGFPAIHLQEYPLEDAYTIVRDIYNSTIFFDIVKRNQVRKVDQLERVVKFVFDNVGRTFSAKSISDYLKSEHRTIDNETVYSYLEKLAVKSLLLKKSCISFICSGVYPKSGVGDFFGIGSHPFEIILFDYPTYYHLPCILELTI